MPNFNLNLIMFLIVFIGMFVKHHQKGESFSESYKRENKKWMVIDTILFFILCVLIYINRKNRNVYMYMITLLSFFVMIYRHYRNYNRIVDNNLGETSEEYRDDMFNGTLFDGFILGISLSYLLKEYK